MAAYEMGQGSEVVNEWGIQVVPLSATDWQTVSKNVSKDQFERGSTAKRNFTRTAAVRRQP